jgi:hypothetical protein
VTPHPRITLPQRSSDDAGPALTFNNDRLILAWTDDNQHVRVMFSDDRFLGSWSAPLDLGHSSDNAGPALAVMNSSIVCIAWIEITPSRKRKPTARWLQRIV